MQGKQWQNSEAAKTSIPPVSSQPFGKDQVDCRYRSVTVQICRKLAPYTPVLVLVLDKLFFSFCFFLFSVGLSSSVLDISHPLWHGSALSTEYIPAFYLLQYPLKGLSNMSKLAYFFNMSKPAYFFPH